MTWLLTNPRLRVVDFTSERSDHLPFLPSLQVTVGVITPYRSQRDLIRDTFRRLLGPGADEDARIETVDSFQV